MHTKFHSHKNRPQVKRLKLQIESSTTQWRRTKAQPKTSQIVPLT